MRTFLLAPLLVIVLSGCASTTLNRYLAHPRTVPDEAELVGVPYIKQRIHHCGPATLAMAMQWSGRMVTADSLAEKMITPGEKGTYQSDFLGTIRREGFLGVPVDNLDSLFQEVAAGNPVIVFQNLGFSWFPVWHYAVVIGYDIPERRVTLHSAGDANHSTRMSVFESDWGAADYWAVVVLPPTRLSATGDEIAHLQAAAGLERVGHIDEAEKTYLLILQRWPHSLGALVGLGNIRFARGDSRGSVSALLEASRHHPKSAAVWHNLALAQAKLNHTREARLAAKRAMAEVPAGAQSEFRDSLAPLL